MENKGGRPVKRRGGARENAGRKRKSKDEELSESTILRRAKELIEDENSHVVVKAFKLLQIQENKENNGDQEQPEEVIKTEPHTNESALAFFLENNLTVQSYKNIAKDARKRITGLKNIYPSYYFVEKAKKDCLSGIQITTQNEVVVQCTLQSMLGKSAERLVESVGSAWDQNPLKLYISYGFDSSAGHKNPHQGFQNQENETRESHMSLFASVAVILAITDAQTRKVLWLNPSPQSVRFCRPLRLAYEKETLTALTTERDRLREEVETLQPHTFTIKNGKEFTIVFDCKCSLLDGKALNAVVENDCSTKCPICLVHMTKFNTSLDWQAVIDKDHLCYGLGILHCEIKTFVFLLQVSYKMKLGLKSWNCPKNLTPSMRERKAVIQKRLFDSFHVHADQVLQGAGTTNNENTARTCFADPIKFAEALEIDSEIVKRLAIILIAFKQKSPVNQATLKRYCNETYCLIYSIYDWIQISPSVHKMLRHGVDIQSNLALPISYYAEDAGESAHKHYRNNATAHARQISREARLFDIFNYSTYFSDPLISSILIKDRLLQKPNRPLPSFFFEVFPAPQLQPIDDNSLD